MNFVVYTYHKMLKIEEKILIIDNFYSIGDIERVKDIFIYPSPCLLKFISF